MVSAFVTVTVDVHVSVPALTFIVSPREALLTHVAKDVLSGVVVHVGLEPVQAA